MSRTANAKRAPTESAEILPAAASAVEAGQALQIATEQSARALAAQLGYEGAVAVGALEDGIRFYQRRTVEAILETGKRLLLLKELTPHGEFISRCELLGFADRTARRFMQAAAKTAKSANLAVLSAQVKSASAFLELVTHDDDDLEALRDIDDIDRMSASELRAALREIKAESEATSEVLAKKNAKIDKLEREKKLIARLPPEEAWAAVKKEASAIMADALGAIRGNFRQALVALADERDVGADNAVFMAGLVGQLAAELAALRSEFDLPDVSNAADQALMAEVAQWAPQAAAAN
ncbi:hypothetical protein [Ottowia beijingensis]|uniref:hypothetical protein n=1 Tax=Ottowia beijingensis TaxID=1207057 RepID=UPI0036387347